MRLKQICYNEAEMHITKIIVPWSIEEKLNRKHAVDVEDVREILLNPVRIRFAEKGHVSGENVYAALGQTLAGRYLIVFFVYKPIVQTAIVISGRDMSRKERKQYGRK